MDSLPPSRGSNAAEPKIIRRIKDLAQSGGYHARVFSYRHAFHAGNHADVLKHMVLLATLRYLAQKEAPLAVIDTHAGAGLYRLDGDYATTSGEAKDGILKLAKGRPGGMAPILQEYLEAIGGFNAKGGVKTYPGSPFVAYEVLRDRPRDRLRLFELHPTDSKALAGNVAQLDAGRRVAVERADGFAALPALLPPPQKRALVVVDPSYEIKSDYAKVSACLQDALKRFSTGVYLVWYPIIPRPEAHELPRRLKTLANKAGRPWLHATLSIGRSDDQAAGAGLAASGVFLVNPPHVLAPALREALPQLVEVLGRGRGQGFAVESSPS